jgi:hypothetical protein
METGGGGGAGRGGEGGTSMATGLDREAPPCGSETERHRDVTRAPPCVTRAQSAMTTRPRAPRLLSHSLVGKGEEGRGGGVQNEVARAGPRG